MQHNRLSGYTRGLVRLSEQSVEAVLSCSCAGFGSCGSDIALGRDHGFVAEKLHQCVGADVGVGELGRECVA